MAGQSTCLLLKSDTMVSSLTQPLHTWLNLVSHQQETENILKDSMI